MRPHVARSHPDATTAHAQRERGLDRFAAGDLAGAHDALAAAVEAGALDAEIALVLGGLLADRGDAAAAVALYERFLDGPGSSLTPANQLLWYRLLFDTAQAAGSVDLRAAALDLLAASAAAGDWSAVLDPHRRAAIEAILVSPTERLDLYEQYTFAPERTGLPEAAASHLLALGIAHAAQPDLARAAERLLHGMGRPQDAYAIERARRAARPAARRRGEVDAPDGAFGAQPDLAGLQVVIAGGHPALRRQIVDDLRGAGAAEVREVPPAWEGVLGGRDVRDRVTGTDLAVLIGRRLPHSTAKQVRSVAARSGVPVIEAETAGALAVRRAIERWRTNR